MRFAEPPVPDGPQQDDFARLCDMAIDLLAVADAEGRYTALNEAWQRTLGWTREELMSASLLEFVHADDRDATLAIMERTADAGFELERFENRYRCRDGSYRWLSWRASTDGVQWYAVARDVTERKAREHEQLEQMSRMRSMLIERTRESRSSAGALEIAETEIVRRLSMVVEWRDDDTGEHIDRMGRLSGLLTQRAGLDSDLWEPMRFASPLHDAGKVAIPDRILLKPGLLSFEERAIMQTHAQLGYELLRGSGSPILELAATIAWTHHERFDGQRLPARPRRGGDPDRGARRGHRRCLRRAHQRPRIPPGVSDAEGPVDDGRGSWNALRPAPARHLLRRDRRDDTAR